MWWWVEAQAAPESLDLAERMVAEIGPRPAGSGAVDRSLDWVSERLVERGWSPRRWTGDRAGGVVACRTGETPGTVLFFAHVDSVHADCPGANDNAAAVGALLELASRIEPGGPRRTVCLAFPDGEELGLRGSFVLQASGSLPDVNQVVALDLVGRGTPTHNGLGPAFTAADARALLRAAPADVPFVYRALSHGAPHMERSDHLPWSRAGIPASHLMSRGESGVYWAYHTSADTPDQLDPATMSRVVDLLEAVADLPPLGAGAGEPWFVVPFTRLVVPGWMTWVLLGSGAALGLGAASRREVPSGPAWRVPLALGCGALALVLASGGRSLGGDLAPFALGAAWLAMGGVLAGTGGQPSVWASRLCVLGAWVVVAALLWAGLPLLALPGAAVAGGVGLASLVGRYPNRAVSVGLWGLGLAGAAWPGLYLVRPAAVRELGFHGLVPASPWLWAGLFVVLAAPVAVVLGERLERHRWVAGACGVGVLLAIGVGWATPERSGIFAPPPMLWPEVQRSAPLPGEGDAIP
ncbi:MAG: M28 family peptidase [Myxococcota bacterium]